MVSPIIICNGVIRSGSTWSFNVCRLMATILAGQRGQPVGSAYLGAEQLERFLFVDSLMRDGPAVIKSHELGPEAITRIRKGSAKAVCTMRDPRDCVASDMVFYGRGFDASVDRVVLSFSHLQKHAQDFGRTLFIRYEDMIGDRAWQVRRIAAYLNIRLDRQQIEAIDRETNIDTCRQICEDLKEHPEKADGADMYGHKREFVTLLHDNHIGTGMVGRWRKDLTPQQAERVTEIFQRAVEILGYPDATGLGAMIPDGAHPPRQAAMYHAPPG